jgi:branched-chain amino acid transport system permease protein
MEYLLHILVITCIYAVGAASLNLVVGCTGLPALGHAAFSCIGAYTSSLLAMCFGISPWWSLLAGACGASIIGGVAGVPSLRVRGDHLALVTFGLGLIVYSVVKNWTGVTRGPMGLAGIPVISIMGHPLSSPGTFLIPVAAATALSYFVMHRIVNSPFGTILRAIRDDETAAMAVGKNAGRYKITVFAAGAFFAGIAGGLYAQYVTFIDPSSFTVMESITLLLMVVFGGLGSLRGSLLGAAVLVIFPEMLRFVGLSVSVAAPVRQMLFGLLLVIMMICRPQGILGNHGLK